MNGRRYSGGSEKRGLREMKEMGRTLSGCSLGFVAFLLRAKMLALLSLAKNIAWQRCRCGGAQRKAMRVRYEDFPKAKGAYHGGS